MNFLLLQKAMADTTIHLQNRNTHHYKNYTFTDQLETLHKKYKFKQCLIFKNEILEHVNMWLVNALFIFI